MLTDLNAILERHEHQGYPPGVIREVRSLLRDEDDVDAQQYQPNRAAQLKATRRAAAVDAIVAELSRLDTATTARAAQELDAQARAEHARVTSGNGHNVDPHRFTAATTPAEIVLLLRDAEAADPDTLRKAWAYAEPKLRAMAQAEQRSHRLPAATSAFNALVTWQGRMRSLSHRAPDGAQLSEAMARQRQEIKQQVLAVARMVGLDVAVEQAMRKAALPEPPTSTITVGGFFDRFGK
jgi:hypothetical protein